MASRPKILIDCDPGHDDAVAILFAHRHLDLVGVTTVHGNNTLANTTLNALRVLALGAIAVPVAAGAAVPLVQDANPPAALHGSSGLDGASLPAPVAAPLALHGAEFIIEMASKHRGALVLAVLGPQTNVALALRREPRLKDWLAEITIMGGSTALGNITPVAEFNIHCDPEAAAIVFESGVPIRMVGYNVTRTTGFDGHDIARLRASGRGVARTMADLLDFYLHKQRQAFALELAPMHDVCAIVPYVAPQLIDYAHTSVSVELAGTHTRGQTVCDLRNVQAAAALHLRGLAPANARVALAARARPLIDLVIDTLLTYP